MNTHVVKAIVKRELAGYFSVPTGYVFITIFIFLSAFAAFWVPGFFERNLANLDQLNAWFPALLVFLVPAITMGAWAEERKTGTDELLLTLPAQDWELVLGKYLACLSIYGAALVFSLGHVAVLYYLGRPDVGVLVSTYLGHLLAGAALISVGLIGSAITGNLTLAFIVSAVLCVGVVGLGQVAAWFPNSGIAGLATRISFTERFSDFGRGVVTLENVGYFIGLGLIGFWVNVFLVGRRHWAGSKGTAGRSGLAFVRGVCFVVAAGALVTLLARTAVRADTTQERLWSLSPETARLAGQVSEDRPVLITAYVSPEVPVAFVQTRDTLLGLLRELSTIGGGKKIEVRVLDTEPYSENAREAKRNFNIEPVMVPPSPEDTEPRAREVFLGVAFTCGPEQFVIPFLSKGLPVEYELARSIRTVTAQARKKVGVLETEAQLIGEFNYQTFQPGRDWPIVEELRKQYEVTKVAKGQPVPDDINVLLVAQPSSMSDADLVHVVNYVKAGRAAIIFEDPLSMVSPALSTSEPRGGGNPFAKRQNDAPKANLKPLYDALGIEAPASKIVWDSYNPRPQFADIPHEFCFIGRASGSGDAFNDSDSVTAGLQEVALLCAGEIKPAATVPTGAKFTPLLRTSPRGGLVEYSQMLQRSVFGVGGLNPARRPHASPGRHVLAARINAPAAGDSKGLNVVFVSDLDCVGEMFFRMREQGFSDLEFDNVTFVLNAMDSLAGDESLLELRKRRREHRTLQRLDEVRNAEQTDQLAAIEAANDKAEEELKRAQDALNTKVEEIKKRTDLDDSTKQIMLQSVQEAEQRRLDVQKAAIEDDKAIKIEDARAVTKQRIDKTKMNIRLAAVLLPPIPALVLAGVVFVNRRRQETAGVARERLR